MGQKNARYNYKKRIRERFHYNHPWERLGSANEPGTKEKSPSPVKKVVVQDLVTCSRSSYVVVVVIVVVVVLFVVGEEAESVQ